MLLSAPWWLLALFPWAGLTLYLLRGQSPRVGVPFVELWQDPDLPRPRRARSLRLPPFAIAMMLLGLLLAILAAARPAMRVSTIGPPITIIVDRGVTMSSNPIAGDHWTETLRDIERRVVDRFGRCPVDLMSIPMAASVARSDTANWAASIVITQPTALDTSNALALAIQAALQRNDHPVVVVTNQEIALKDERLTRIAPATEA